MPDERVRIDADLMFFSISYQLICQSEIVRTCIALVVVPVTLISMISPIMDDCGAMMGALTPKGNWLDTMLIFSFTICLARKISVPHSNSTQTMERPIPEDDRTR